MTAPADEGLVEPQARSLLAVLFAPFVGEHICAPPDSATRWAVTSEDAARKPAPCNVYVCPECGQHLARIGT